MEEICKDGCIRKHPIVNKRYGLCMWCNHIRLHGKTIYETNFERKICKISNDEKYFCSDGTKVSQNYINRQLTKIKSEVYNERPSKCEGLSGNTFKLSISHTISVDRCKKLRKTELIWDKNNLFIEGYHDRVSRPLAAHNIWEDGKIKDKIKLLNFDKKMLYLQENDAETYQKYKQELDKL